VYQVPVALIILVVRAVVHLANVKSGKAAPFVWPDPRRIFWSVAAVVACAFAAMYGLVLLAELHDDPSPAAVRAVAAYAAAAGGVTLAFVRPWMLLYPLARRGHFRLVYYGAQLSPLFFTTDNTRGGALLLSAFALAYAPSCTETERALLARSVSVQEGA
jgi:hypothetical protein